MVWLDYLAKWSMFDVYTLVLFMLAMNLNISSPDRFVVLPTGLYNVEVILSPQLGLYCNLIAQVVSQLASHAEIHYHRRVVDDVVECLSFTSVTPTHGGVSSELSNSGGVTASVCSYTHSVVGTGLRARIVSVAAKTCVPLALALGVVLFVLGAFLPTLTVTTSGVVGMLLDLGSAGDRASTLSSIQMVEALAGQFTPSFFSKAGIILLTFIFVASTLIMPLLQALVWIIMWAVPMTLRRLERLALVSEIMSAWSFFDVFLIAVLITSLQVERLAHGMIGTLEEKLGSEQFNVINNVVVLLQDIGVVDSSDAKLLSVSANLEHGAYILLLAAILMGSAGIFINSQTASFLKSTQSEAIQASANKV